MQAVHDRLDDLEHCKGGNAVADEHSEDPPPLEFADESSRFHTRPPACAASYRVHPQVQAKKLRLSKTRGQRRSRPMPSLPNEAVGYPDPAGDQIPRHPPHNGNSSAQSRRATRDRAENSPALRSSDHERSLGSCRSMVGENEGPEAPVQDGGSPGPFAVGATGFEPATTCTPSKCATRLRHAPI